jgi:methionine sulfoxide reductase heme-binding subunit
MPGPVARKAALKTLSTLAWRFLPPVTFVLCLLPLGKLGIDGATGRLGANPIAEILNRLGWWTLFLLTFTLACTPAHLLFRINWPLSIRRTLGLFAFTYACLHFLTYLGVDKFFAWGEIIQDVAKRKFIAVGFIAFLLLIPLAVTSTRKAVKRLGYRKWKRLHRLVYLTGTLGVIHFYLRVKADHREPLIFISMVAGLFLVRAGHWLRGRRRRGRSQKPVVRGGQGSHTEPHARLDHAVESSPSGPGRIP